MPRPTDPIVVSYLSGELRQRRTGCRWASLRDLPAAAAEPTVAVAEVDDAFARAAGANGPGPSPSGGRPSRRSSAARPRRSSDSSSAGRRRAPTGRARRHHGRTRWRAPQMSRVDGPAGRDAGGRPSGGRGGGPRGRRRGARPVPARGGPSAAADARQDGDVGRGRHGADRRRRRGGLEARRRADPGASRRRRRSPCSRGRSTRSRTGCRRSWRPRSPCPVRSIVLDGEAIALRPDGRPRPFQQTASRAASRGDVDALRREVPLTPFFFDVLRVDEADLIDLPAAERHAAVDGVVPARAVGAEAGDGDVDAAQAFFDDAVARGHEGVVVKALDAPYEAGRRGGAWLKVKPVHTLDLVVLAAEWGHGRRKGWLSNLHLGARDPETGGFVMLGKTFKGLTDELLRWQTERLLELETHARASPCSSARSWSWRSRSTGSRRARGIPPAWRFGSRGSSATGRTSARRGGHRRDCPYAARWPDAASSQAILRAHPVVPQRARLD